MKPAKKVKIKILVNSFITIKSQVNLTLRIDTKRSWWFLQCVYDRHYNRFCFVQVLKRKEVKRAKKVTRKKLVGSLLLLHSLEQF